MLALSAASLRERWTLFAGAALTVVVGVALVQSSLLLLISAATAATPAGLDANGRLDFDLAMTNATAVLAVTMGFAAFFAVFVISSTFAFTVDQRRRELALLRLVGFGRRQVSRLLLGEAVILGGLGAIVAIPAGAGVLAAQTALMRRLDFLPDDFTAQGHAWIFGASLGIGILLAVLGVILAAHRAGRVPPLAALHDLGASTRSMGWTRWLAGLIFLGGAVALIIVSGAVGPVGGQVTAMNVSICAAIGLAALGPVLVPAVARVVPLPGHPAVRELVRANLLDDRRRTASVAAPLLVLTAIVLGQLAASGSFTDSGADQRKRNTAADLVVEGTGAIPRIPGIAVASSEISLPVTLTVDGGAAGRSTDVVSALIIDPQVYGQVHRGSGDLTALDGRVVVAGAGAGGYGVDGTVGVATAGLDLGRLKVVAREPQTMAGGAVLLLPRGLVPADQLTGRVTQTFVRLAPGADADAVRSRLAEAGRVSKVDDWLDENTKRQNRANLNTFLVVLGLGAVYAGIGVVNSVVMATAARRREFAEARVTGLTRHQVVAATVLEALAVTTGGLVLGVLAAGGTLIAVLGVTSSVTGRATLVLPWAAMATVTGAAFLLTMAAAALTTRSATRERPVTLVAARE